MLRFIQLQRGFPHFLLHFPENGEGQNPVSQKVPFFVFWQSFQLFLRIIPTKSCDLSNFFSLTKTLILNTLALLLPLMTVKHRMKIDLEQFSHDFLICKLSDDALIEKYGVSIHAIRRYQTKARKAFANTSLTLSTEFLERENMRIYRMGTEAEKHEAMKNLIVIWKLKHKIPEVAQNAEANVEALMRELDGVKFTD
jgi:hypothetical protein